MLCEDFAEGVDSRWLSQIKVFLGTVSSLWDQKRP
jgi:hypothetical protein